MEIRKANLKDMGNLLKLWEDYENFHLDLTKKAYIRKFLQTNKNAIFEMRKYFKKQILSGDSEILVAEDSGEIIGFLLLSFREFPSVAKIKKYGHIGYFFVKKNMRGKGVGRKIYKKSLEYLKKRNIKRISLDVNFLNKKTIDFYKKLGFKEFEIKMLNDFD